jgi:hypothetical protein
MGCNFPTIREMYASNLEVSVALRRSTGGPLDSVGFLDLSTAREFRAGQLLLPSEAGLQCLNCETLYMSYLQYCLIAAAVSLPIFAQDPGAGQSKPQGVDSTSEASSAREMARQWVEKKGWDQGENKDGAFVAIGSASFPARGTESALAHSNAFQLAALKAKNVLAEFLAKEISTDVAATLKEGEVPADTNGVSKDVIQNLAAEAKKEGGADVQKILNSTTFSSAVKAAARAEVSGAAVSNSFISVTPDGDGSLAVVMRFTAASRSVAAAAVGKGAAPANSDLADAKTWLKTMSEQDLSVLFGTRLFRTGTDEVCVLSFGQADVRGRSENAFDSALEKAKLAAFGELRQFVGEMVQSEGMLNRQSSLRETAEAGMSFNDTESFQKSLRAAAQKLEFQGAKPLRSWEFRPSGAGPVCGVVLMWSVSGSDVAKNLKREMEAVGGSQGGSGRRDLPATTGASGKGRDIKTGQRPSAAKETPEP